MSEFINGCFDAKLRELDKAYAIFQERCQFYRLADKEELGSAKDRMEKIWIERRNSLYNEAQGSNSPLLSQFASLQGEYCKRMEDTFQKTIASSDNADKMPVNEVNALYAEYALDYVILSLDHAIYRMFMADDVIENH